MADYLVRMVVHLIPALKPEGWRNPVQQSFVFSVNTIEELREKVSTLFKVFAQQGGIVITADHDFALADDTRTMDLAQFVPFNIIQFIQPDTTPITPISVDEFGKKKEELVN